MTRLAVVGAGSMGANHARVAATVAPGTLVAVVDPDPHRAGRVAGAHGVRALNSIDELPGLVDAVILATPTELHESTALPLLEAGVDILVEKPIALDEEAAQRMIETASAHGRILMVGHVERFNPAVIELPRFISAPRHLRFTRIGPFSPRVTTDVVADLMVHDIDIALHLIGSPVTSVMAVGHKVKTEMWDLASALVTFESGITASFTASRVGQGKVREIAVTEEHAEVTVDLLRQDITIARTYTNEFSTDGGTSYRQSGLLEIPLLEVRGEPLGLELQHFLDCLTTRNEPRVSGLAGLQALQVVQEVKRRLAGD